MAEFPLARQVIRRAFDSVRDVLKVTIADILKSQYGEFSIAEANVFVSGNSVYNFLFHSNCYTTKRVNPHSDDYHLFCIYVLAKNKQR